MGGWHVESSHPPGTCTSSGLNAKHRRGITPRPSGGRKLGNSQAQTQEACQRELNAGSGQQVQSRSPTPSPIPCTLRGLRGTKDGRWALAAEAG